MTARRHAAALAFAAAAGLALPAVAPARTVTVPLCGGGSMPMHLPGPGHSGEKSCHACLMRDRARPVARAKGRAR